jgi:hypothetical protein
MLFLGFFLGILSSLVAWWIATRLIVPSVKFSDDISKLEYENSSSGYHYRVKLENNGRRGVIDLEIFVIYRVKGISIRVPDNWYIAYIESSIKRIPKLGKGMNRLISIYPENTEDFKKNNYPDDIQKSAIAKTLTLEQLLKIGKQAKIQIVAYGYDQFSGSRKVFESKFYRIEDIKLGFFEKKGMSVVGKTQSN